MTMKDKIDIVDGIDVSAFLHRDRGLDPVMPPAERAYWDALGAYHAKMIRSMFDLAAMARNPCLAGSEIDDIVDDVVGLRLDVERAYAKSQAERCGSVTSSLSP